MYFFLVEIFSSSSEREASRQENRTFFPSLLGIPLLMLSSSSRGVIVPEVSRLRLAYDLDVISIPLLLLETLLGVIEPLDGMVTRPTGRSGTKSSSWSSSNSTGS